MSIVESKYGLVVKTPISDYIIEPIRFTLGLSRVQMVDDHLAQLIKDKRDPNGDAMNELLEARSQFVAEESINA